MWGSSGNKWLAAAVCALAAFACTIQAAKSPTKTYTGYKLSPKSLRMIYYHDQTIAIVEIGEGKSLLNCELVEI